LEQGLIDAARRLHREIIFKAGSGSTIDALASSFVQQKVAVIVALGTPAALAAKRATSTIPIIMVGVSDPVQLGIVPSLAHPAGNVTGVSFLAPELVQKSLGLLGDISPRPTRIGVLLNPDNPGATFVLKTIQPTAQALGMELLPVEIRSPIGISEILRVVKLNRSDGLLILADPIFNSSRTEIVEFAKMHKILTVFQLRDYVDGGGLISYGPSEQEIYELSSRYLVKILQGAKPADLPVEQPTKFQLVINLKTAKALGLRIPPSLLGRADEVIQ
jgi:putative ABC transport system substrate-binding protein